MKSIVNSNALYESLYSIVYGYLHDIEKLNYGIVCKSFYKFIKNNINIKIAKNKIKGIFEKLKIQENYYFSNRYKLLFEHIPKMTLKKLSIGYDYIMIRHCEECWATINVYSIGGKHILQLDVDHNKNEINKIDFFICSCVYYGYGLIDKYLSNRDEFYVNGKFIGTNLLKIENNKYVIDNKEYTKLFKTINETFISKKIYPKIFKMIKIHDDKEYVDFLNKKEFYFDDSLYNFLKKY